MKLKLEEVGGVYKLYQYSDHWLESLFNSRELVGVYSSLTHANIKARIMYLFDIQKNMNSSFSTDYMSGGINPTYRTVLSENMDLNLRLNRRLRDLYEALNYSDSCHEDYESHVLSFHIS